MLQNNSRMNIVSILKNKVVFYLVSRYVTYAVQFITSLIIAAELGPYYMGIWGFILLLLQYFQQFHFGIANSFNVLYVQHRENKQECNNYIGNSLVLLSVLCSFVVSLYVLYIFWGDSLFARYHVGKYMIWVCLIAILQYYVEFLTNLFRVKNQLNSVAFCQSIVVFICFVSVIFFKGEELIQWLVASYVIGNFLCVLLALISKAIPKFEHVKFSFKYQKEILKKGLFLFLYNSCFYFIIISLRTIISDNYSVEEFGLFSFSYTLANSIFFIIGALGFVIFPKVIGKLSSRDDREVCVTISFLRSTYVTLTHFLVYLAIVVFPILIFFMPQYDNCITAFNLIALTILVTTCSYGYLELLISRNREKTMSILSASALVVNFILAIVIVKFYRVSFSYVIIATMLTYLLYTMLITTIASHLLGLPMLFAKWFPLRLMIPYSVALLLSFVQTSNWMFVPLLLFLLMNWHQLLEIKNTSLLLLKKPDKVNL